MHRKDRESRGGGVLIAVSNSVASSMLPSPPELEIITVKFRINQFEAVICNCYIPPNTADTLFVTLLRYLSNLLSNHNRVIITGDFNLPDINWSSLSGHSYTSNTFCDFVYDNNLFQLVDTPTHVGGNLLDLVLTSDTQLIDDLCVLEPAGSFRSDHLMITFNLCHHSASTPQRPPRGNNSHFVFDFPKADMDGLCSYLESSDFSACFQSSDVDFVWSTIKLLILNAVELFIPMVRLKSRQYPKWFSSNIRHDINCLRTLRRKCKSHPSPASLSKLSRLESLLESKISLAKSTYETNLIHQFATNNSSKIYKHIRSFTALSSIPTTVELNSVFGTADSDKVSLFNSYFHSIFTHSCFELPPLDTLSTPASTICDFTITSSEVFEALTSFDPTKATGIDGIGPRLLKECAHALYTPFHYLFCLSFSQHSIPLDWRSHMIIPIHKAGDQTLVSNYSPISLLCCISKVLERIIYNHLLDFACGSLSRNQFGFMRNRSSAQQLLTFLHTVYDSFQSKSQTDVIYLDFSKAFDSVSHKELLAKLWCFGFRGKIWCWLKAYLSHRLQCVSINGNRSGLLPVISGVPQGSILGPLLFLIFINDLPDSTHSSSLLLYADDAKCFRPIASSTDHHLQDDLNSLFNWSLKWRLCFNNYKCALLRLTSGYSSSQSPPTTSMMRRLT